MSRTVVAAALLLSLLALPRFSEADPPGGRVSWQKNLKAAHQLSNRQNKPMLLVFGADWCTYCKKLERNTINHPEMSQYINENFVPVHLDADHDAKVAEILEVRSLPCTIVLSPKADLLGRFEGYSEVPEFQKKLEQAQEIHLQAQIRQTSSIR